jgi:tRNA(fMet)-specific endonuclease VapC
MILLDTDHLTVLSYPDGVRHGILTGRMQNTEDETFATSIISAEETLRGWLAFVKQFQDVHKQIPAYERLGKMLSFLGDWDIIPFDQRAADELMRLKNERVRIGTQDMKIASIALVNDALLLTANRRDFERVPGLRFENWLE